MSAALRLLGCALALLAQGGDDLARVRAAVRGWIAAERAASDLDRAGATAARAAAERSRVAVLRAWPRGAAGDGWLRDVELLRVVFAGCFPYGVPAFDLPGVRVAVPAGYDPARPVPAVVEVWPRSGADPARFGPRAETAHAIVVTTSPARLQALVQRYRPRTVGAALLALAVQVAQATPAAALAGQLWALGPGEADEELLQRGLFFLLGELQRHYNVDRDRLVVDAAAAACRVALRAAAAAPDRFAGIVLRAPQALPAVAVENLTGIGVLLLRRESNGGRAGLALAEALNAEPYGSCAVHDLAEFDAERLRTWCAERRRDLFRPRVALVIPPDAALDGYWVGDISADVAGASDGEPASLLVIADRAAARITVQARRIESFRLLLNDALIDLDRPFTMEVNGTAIALRRSRSLSLLCDLVLRRFDPGFLFTSSITVTVPRQG